MEGQARHQPSPSSNMSQMRRLQHILTSALRLRSVGRLYITLYLESSIRFFTSVSLQARERYSQRSTAVTWYAPAESADRASNPAQDQAVTDPAGSLIGIGSLVFKGFGPWFPAIGEGGQIENYDGPQITIYCLVLDCRCPTKALEHFILYIPNPQGSTQSWSYTPIQKHYQRIASLLGAGLLPTCTTAQVQHPHILELRLHLCDCNSDGVLEGSAPLPVVQHLDLPAWHFGVCLNGHVVVGVLDMVVALSLHGWESHTMRSHLDSRLRNIDR